MILADIVATLAHEPFCLSLDQIKRLSLFQVKTIYFRAKDDRGRLKRLPPPGGENISQEKGFAIWRVSHRVPEWFRKQKYG